MPASSLEIPFIGNTVSRTTIPGKIAPNINERALKRVMAERGGG
jgi:hypothetical protein